MQTLEDLLKKAQELNEAEKFDEVIELLSDEVLETYISADLYAEKAEAYYRLDEINLCSEVLEKALLIDEKQAKANNYKGNLYFISKEYYKAMEAYNKAIKIDPKYASPYYGLGIVYYYQKEYDKALEEFKKAIEIDPKFENSYNGLGIAYMNLKEKEDEKAIEAFKKAIEIDPEYVSPYYNRGLAYYSLSQYPKALADFEKYYELTKDSENYFTTIAQSKIEELRKIIGSPITKEISELVGKIKELLLFQGDCVTHYTTFSTTKKLIFDKSKFWLSEGAFLNDTSEGRELFKFLPDFNSVSCSNNDTMALLLAQKPFIGSFVAKDKHDDLTLWRMYGKEDKDEAKGCAITLHREDLLKKLGETVTAEFKDKMSQEIDKEFCFYRVAYYTNDDQKSFIIPDAPESKKDLNAAMTKLNEITSKIKEQNLSPSDIQNIRRLLNSIAFLFKSAEYQHEYELRMVLSGVGFPKQIEKDTTNLKVYIELVPIDSLIRKITLGPKVDKAEEWGTIFHYHLEKEGYNPEIYISHLPFK